MFYNQIITFHNHLIFFVFNLFQKIFAQLIVHIFDVKGTVFLLNYILECLYLRLVVVLVACQYQLIVLLSESLPYQNLFFYLRMVIIQLSELFFVQDCKEFIILFCLVFSFCFVLLKLYLTSRKIHNHCSNFRNFIIFLSDS